VVGGSPRSGSDPGPGGALVAKCSMRRRPNSRVECPDSMTALSLADRPAIDGTTTSRARRPGTSPRVLAALVGVEDDAASWPAAYRQQTWPSGP